MSSTGSVAAATASSHRVHNRIVMLCASIHDVTAWPFWKFLQLKKVKGVTDLYMLAFNSEGGSFLAKIEGTEYSIKNYEKVIGYHRPMLEEFLDRTYAPGRSYFVYGGHGMGDYLELEENKVDIQVEQLAAMLGHRVYEGILFDACFMANLDCVYHLRRNTKWIGACEGYMWEEDTALDQHIFNTYTASAMSRFRDPKNIFELIQRDYCGKTRLGDFSVLSTEHVESLWNYVERHVWQRVYDGATFLSKVAHEELQNQAEETLTKLHEPGVDDAQLSHSTPSSFAANSGASRRRRLLRATQFRHALYPYEVEDKHLVDLRQYLIEIAAEETGCSLPPPLVAASPSTEGSHTASPPTLQIPDAIAEHEALRLFRNVVSSHTPPYHHHLYASPLGGLSLAVHEFSPLSKRKPLSYLSHVNKDLFDRNADAFLAATTKSHPRTPTKKQSPLTEVDGGGLPSESQQKPPG